MPRRQTGRCQYHAGRGRCKPAKHHRCAGAVEAGEDDRGDGSPRQSSEVISNAVLSYVEPYASSACEMVAEVLQYIADGIRMKSAEADAMYAGIVIDTQNFTNQTGVRTFEAAAFLRRSGADVTRVRKLFRENMVDYQAKAEAVRAAEVYMDAFAISVCPAEGLDSPTIIGAQAANELLEIKGIKASVYLLITIIPFISVPGLLMRSMFRL
mgnify:CR=1 FL=1